MGTYVLSTANTFMIDSSRSRVRTEHSEVKLQTVFIAVE